MKYQCDFAFTFFGYTCEVIKICEVTGTKGTVFIGKHEPGQTRNDVEYLEIFNQSLAFIPRNLHKEFPNLTRLRINGCGLKEIWNEDLIGLKYLQYLDLCNNNLTSLPNDLFFGQRQLHSILFDDNQLECLSSRLLKPIKTSLELAYFLKNPRIDYFFDDNRQGSELKRLMVKMNNLEPRKLEIGTQTESMQNQKFDRFKQMTGKLAEFKASGEFTDFTIRVRGKEFKVHKAVLAAQSSVFRQTFLIDDGTTEKTFTKVKNFSDESFGSFLDFFYSDDVGDKINAMEVFELATVFKVETLKATCTDRILATLSKENALEVFNLGHHHYTDQLKREAFKFIQQIIPEVPSSMIQNRDYINKLVAAKREFDAILEASKTI